MDTADTAKMPRYDAAISFLFKDIDLATQLTNRLGGLEVFFFPRTQETLAGTDGLESMRQPFRRESRLNVVLFRPGWGETPWTGVEQAAIEDRWLEDQFRSLFLVLIEPRSKGVPRWVPDTHISFAWQDFGAEQAAGAIKARVQELGGHIHVETLEEKAERLKGSRNYQNRREEFQRSFEGVAAAKAAFIELKRLVRERLANLSNVLPTRVREDSSGALILMGLADPLKLVWHSHYGNSLESAALTVETWRGHPAVSDDWVIDSDRVGAKEYRPDVSPTGIVGWQMGGRVIGPAEFAEQLLSDQVERAIK